MKRIALENGTWFDASAATKFEEGTRWDGNNHISLATGSQWDHQDLFKTAKGKWVLHFWSQWQGSSESYTVIPDDQAHRWLIRNGHEDAVPEKSIAALEI